MEKSFELSKSIEEIVDKLRLHLPFHLNVIDELYINENAHSRILCKLLQYRNDKGKFEYLESLLEYINEKLNKEEKNNFQNIIIKYPEITQEEERIDLWVKDVDYAIIFENKIYYAQDQEEQISRYIEKTRKHKNKYKDKQIFIVYLLPTSESDPSEQTWGKEKEKFKNNYIKLAYRDDILPWLQKSILPNIRNKDVYLLTAISQYVDYLNGLFSKRENLKKMNKEIQEQIDNLLEMSDWNEEDKIKKLDEEISKLQATVNHLSEYKQKINQEILDNIKAETKIKIEKEYKEVDYLDYGSGGVKIIYKDIVYYLYIHTDGRWYCQFQYGTEVPSEKRDIQNCEIVINSGIRKILSSGRNKDCIWKYSGGSPEKAYEFFQESIKCILDFLNT